MVYICCWCLLSFVLSFLPFCSAFGVFGLGPDIVSTFLDLSPILSFLPFCVAIGVFELGQDVLSAVSHSFRCVVGLPVWVGMPSSADIALFALLV